MLTYNINWGAPDPESAAKILLESGADIVCLQETTPEWEHYLRGSLGQNYSFMQFRSSAGRMGGGLAFLSKLPARDIAYVPSESGWFDGWLMAFETPFGPVQVLNVHLHPPVSERGSFTPSAYFGTGQDRLEEIQRFYEQRRPGLPMLIAGDFNDVEHGAAIKWLKSEGMLNALQQFDRYTPTWEWKTSVITLHRRMDHIFYSPDLHCCSARVLRAGASDHFPVTAVFVTGL
jgi:vancomycin resistance protein VanJ